MSWTAYAYNADKATRRVTETCANYNNGHFSVTRHDICSDISGNKTTIEKQLYQLTETKTENWPDQKITDLRTGINNTKNVDIDNEHETKMTLGN